MIKWTYLGPCQATTTELLCKNNQRPKPLTSFAKNSIIDVWQNSTHVSNKCVWVNNQDTKKCQLNSFRRLSCHLWKYTDYCTTSTLLHKKPIFNPLNANPTKCQTHSNNPSAFADELFECVWPFCGIGAWRVKKPRSTKGINDLRNFSVSLPT